MNDAQRAFFYGIAIGALIVGLIWLYVDTFNLQIVSNR